MVIFRYFFAVFLLMSVLQADFISELRVTNYNDGTGEFLMNGDFSTDGHFQFYIDIDNNKNSGITVDEVKGADYLIEDNYLVKRTAANNGWDWKNAIKKDLHINKTKTDIWLDIDYQYLGLKDGDNPIIQIKGATMNSAWKSYNSYPLDTMQQVQLKYSQDANNDDIGAIQKIELVGNDIEVTGNFSDISHFEILIDTDGDMGNGYKGSEFLIHDDGDSIESAEYINNDWTNWKSINGSKTNDKITATVDKTVFNVKVVTYKNDGADSWTTAHTKSQKIDANPATTIKVSKTKYNENEEIVVTISNLQGNEKDWVGIYKQADDNNWSKVQSWAYTKGEKNTTIALSGVTKGTYEARVFFDNTFNLEAKVEFTVGVNLDNGDDEQYLLENLEIDDSNGKIVIKDDTGKKLIDAKNADFISIKHQNENNHLNLNFSKITTNNHGFDIDINISNNSSKTLPLEFSFTIPGIRFNSGNNLNVLNTQTYMVPKSMDFSDYKIRNINPVADKNNGRYIEEHISYPKGYSPVIVVHNGAFAVGASMLTTYNREQIALQQLVKHNDDNSWSLIFKNTKVGAGGQDGAGVRKLSAKLMKVGDSENIKITVRFSKAENWIYTLAPYKQFFNNRFTDKHIVDRNTTPILGMTFSWSSKSQNKSTNDDTMLFRKGYGYDGIYHEDRQFTYVNDLNSTMHAYDLKRVMFWGISGQYYGYDYFDKNESDYYGNSNKLKINKSFNLPAQFLHNLEPAIANIVEDIKTKLTGIDYGFWWGRSGEISMKNGHIIKNDEWNPDMIIQSNMLEHKSHIDYAKYQLLYTALHNGATEIGLDAFSNMDVLSQFKWIKEIKNYVKEQHKKVKFMQEGIMCDYLHTEFSMFLQPNIKWFNRDKKANFDESPVLANYLNTDKDGHKPEIIVWLKSYNSKKIKFINKLRGYGFTPLIEVKDGNIKYIEDIYK